MNTKKNSEKIQILPETLLRTETEFSEPKKYNRNEKYKYKYKNEYNPLVQRIYICSLQHSEFKSNFQMRSTVSNTFILRILMY